MGESENKVGKYLELTSRAKESRKKYEAIQKAWKLPVKPLALTKGSLISKIRWRR